jgi:hypothetical protein
MQVVWRQPVMNIFFLEKSFAGNGFPALVCSKRGPNPQYRG